MASYKIDKLQKLVEEENKIKEQRRILMEEIELEIEKTEDQNWNLLSLNCEHKQVNYQKS